MKKNHGSRIVAALLAVVMLLAGAPVALAQSPQDPALGAQSTLTAAQQALEACVSAYDDRAADWEELSALYAAAALGDYTAGVDLTGVALPSQAPSAPSAAVYYALMTGDGAAAKTAAEQLIADGKVADPGYAYGYALNILAVEAYNNAVDTPLAYDRANAVTTLLQQRDGDGYTYEGTPLYDTAGLALAALTLFSDEDAVGVEQARTALIAWITEGIEQGIGDANSLALVITGLVAAGENTDKCLKELLTCYLGEGKFESSYAPGEPNAFATKQAARALAEAISGKSFFIEMVNNPHGFRLVAQQALEACVSAYDDRAADWEELSALYAAAALGDYAAGVDLTGVMLPSQAPSAPSAAVYYALMTGDEAAAKTAAEQLIADGKIVDPGYAYTYALNILAVEAYNNAADMPLAYDRANAVTTLLQQRDGDGYTYEGTPLYDTAGLALAALTLFSDGDAVGVEQARAALIAWITEGIEQGIGDANSLALVITGLVAAGENTDDCLKELLTCYLGEGKFESSYAPGEPDAFATKQAARALAEAIHRVSYHTAMRLNAKAEGTGGEGGGEGGGSGEGGGAETDDFVYITVTGPNNTTMLSRTKLVLTSGMTPLEALRKSGLSITEESGYVSAIEGVKERDYGVGSGWLFKVNEIYGIMQGATQYRLKANDELVWYYTHDYVKDEGSKSWSEENKTLETPSIAPKQARLDAAAALLKAAQDNGAPVSDLALLALARSGDAPQKLLEQFYERLLEQLYASQGVLSSNRYTEYSRTVLALTAAGFDPTRVTSVSQGDDERAFDLTAPLADFDKVTKQGVTGAAYALLALDCGNYKAVEYAALRSRYVAYLLDGQLDDGGFALTEDKTAAADPDVTAIVLQALAPYESAAEAVQRAVNRLSTLQQADGGFATYGEPTCESAAQVVIALCCLDIPIDDARFVKEGGSALDAMLRYRLEDGAFSHTSTGEADAMATEQALMALTALSCRERDANLFVTFYDVAQLDEKAALEALAAAGVLRGMGDGRFCPDEPITAAQYYTALARAKGLEAAASQGAWYEGYLEAAAAHGLIDKDELPAPNAPIPLYETRAQAAQAIYEMWEAAS